MAPKSIIVGIAALTSAFLGTTAALGQENVDKTDASSESTGTYRSAVATDHLALAASGQQQEEACGPLTTHYASAVAMEQWAAAVRVDQCGS